MLVEGNRIKVRYSRKLAENGDRDLVGRSGIVTKTIMSEGRLVGVFADFRTMRRTKNRFIPVNAIEEHDHINRLRVMGVLKTTVL